MGSLNMSTAYFSVRDGQWVESEIPLIKAVILPSSRGVHIGIHCTYGLELLTVPHAQCTANMHLDSKELMDCVLSCLQYCNRTMEIGVDVESLSSCLGDFHSRGREFVSVKNNVASSASYTMVQLFHSQVIQMEKIGPLKVCFAFHVMTNYSQEGFLVQTHPTPESAYHPIEGYQLATIPVLIQPDEVIIGLMQQFLSVTNSGKNSFAGLDPFVIMPLTARNMEMVPAASEDARTEECMANSSISKDFTQEQISLEPNDSPTQSQENASFCHMSSLFESIDPCSLEDWEKVGEEIESFPSSLFDEASLSMAYDWDNYEENMDFLLDKTDFFLV